MNYVVVFVLRIAVFVVAKTFARASRSRPVARTRVARKETCPKQYAKLQIFFGMDAVFIRF